MPATSINGMYVEYKNELGKNSLLKIVKNIMNWLFDILFLAFSPAILSPPYYSDLFPMLVQEYYIV